MIWAKQLLKRFWPLLRSTLRKGKASQKLALFFVLIAFPTLFFSPMHTVYGAEKTVTQPQSPQFYQAKVIKILNQGEKVSGTTTAQFQDVQIQILEGSQKGKTITVENGGQTILSDSQKVAPGDTVILTTQDGKQYTIYDKYRVTPMIILLIIFAFVVLLIAQLKGLGSLLGLVISFAVIFFYVMPQILAGADPVQTSIVGSLGILLVTTYLAHGISKQTTVALISTFFSLMATVFIASLAIDFAHLSGMTEDVAVTLQTGAASAINAKGLLLGGIIIGTLGALNDITTTQSAAIFEFMKTNTELTFKDLLIKGFVIGREHIVSMVNTLVLAYAGSSMALLLFLNLNPAKLPFWVMINTEDIGDEIIRTVAGSFGLILVVPIVTVIAAMAAVHLKPAVKKIKEKQEQP